MLRLAHENSWGQREESGECRQASNAAPLVCSVDLYLDQCYLIVLTTTTMHQVRGRGMLWQGKGWPDGKMSFVHYFCLIFSLQGVLPRRVDSPRLPKKPVEATVK
jgi:hypothetical protein